MMLFYSRCSIVDVTGDHSFIHGCITNLTTALGRILFSSVVMVLALRAGVPRVVSSPDLVFLPCICFFVTDFVPKIDHLELEQERC